MEITNEIFRAIGMAIIHSLWQGAIIAALVFFILGITGKSNARVRYITLFTGLTALMGAFIVTLILIYRNNQMLHNWTNESNLLNSMLQPESLKIISPTVIMKRLFDFLEPYYAAIALGWISGFIFLSFRMAGNVLISRFTFRKYLFMPDDSLQHLFDSTRESIGLRAGIKLRVSYQMISPLVIGFLSPMVIIPAAAVSGLSTEQVKAIMVHELAHIRRLDHILIVVQAIARQLMFFHPLTWFLIPEIDRERENCCDDFVIDTHTSSINYIKALAMIQEMNFKAIPANSLTGKSNQLLGRIKRIIKPEMKYSTAFRFTVVMLFLATIGVSAMTLIIKDQQDVKSSIVETVNKEAGRTNAPQEQIQQVTGDSLSESDIRKLNKELELSQKELEKAHKKLEEAHAELRKAQEKMVEAGLAKPTHELSYIHPDNDSWNNEQFREALKIAHVEAEKAMAEAGKTFEEEGIKQGLEHWNLHQIEFKEEMKKAMEEAEKAFQELREQGYPAFVPHVPGIPHTDNPPIPHNEMIPGVPHVEVIPHVEAIPHVEVMPHVEVVPHVEVLPHVEVIPHVPDQENLINEDGNTQPGKNSLDLLKELEN